MHQIFQNLSDKMTITLIGIVVRHAHQVRLALLLNVHLGFRVRFNISLAIKDLTII